MLPERIPGLPLSLIHIFLLILLIVGALTAILCGVLTPQGVLAWLGMEITKLVLVMRRYVDSLLDVFLKSLREYHIL